MARDDQAMASWYEVATRLANASKSVRVLAPLRQDWRLPIDQDFLSYASPPASDRRYLLMAPTRPESREDGFLHDLNRLRWQVMWVNSPPSLLGLIIDDSVAYVAANPTCAFKIDDSTMVRGLASHFDRIWDTGKANPRVEIIYDDVLVTVGPAPLQRIQIATQGQWDHIVHNLARQTEDVYQMNPRQFEELVAELLQRDNPGRSIQLTPPSNDGGRDILVYNNTDLGRHLFLVECKRYARDRPIDVGLVRQFYGVVEGERATAGALVTTSYFTGPAATWVPERNLEYRISLVDYSGLADWLRRLATRAS